MDIEKRSLIEIINDVVDNIFHCCHSYILSHPKNGICVMTVHDKKIYYIVYYDKIYEHYLSHIIYVWDEEIRYRFGCIYGKYFVKICNGLDNDFDGYDIIYDYGRVDEDSNNFCKILRLFLVKPRDARPINRLAFLDISVKTE
jgi:hypothetical protein